MFGIYEHLEAPESESQNRMSVGRVLRPCAAWGPPARRVFNTKKSLIYLYKSKLNFTAAVEALGI